jgi:gliding motility-associated-like protein
MVSSDDVAQGFRWYQVTEDGSESLISETRTVTVSDIGQYRYVAYNDLSIFGDNAECASSAYFWVVPSEVATVEAIEVNRDASGINLTVLVSGAGNYEFSLDEKDGPFQDGNVFLSVSEGDHLIYVRDKNGCGTIEYIFIQTITKGDFPKFFTPNGDGVNDYWQFSPLYDTVASLDTIDIFDRYGKLLVQLSPESRGWDGTFKGKPLPSSTFWYMAVSKNGDEVQGYFALKR